MASARSGPRTSRHSRSGSKIFYLQAAGKTALNSDTAIYAGPGNIAAGHCLLHFATGLGLCTISDGTGTLAGFHARVRVTADSSIPGPVALGRDVQLQSGLDPVGNRPVSERVARWLSSLSAKYIAVFALLVAVPVICTSVYLLYSSYQDNKRALTRLQQEKAKSVSVTIDQYFKDLIARMSVRARPVLVLHCAGRDACTAARDRRHGCVLHRPRRTQDARERGRRALPAAGKLPPHRPTSSRRGRPGSTSAQCTLRGLLSNPGARVMEVVVRARSTGGYRAVPGTRWIRRRDAGSESYSGSRPADASRHVRIRLRGRRPGRADRPPERLRLDTSFVALFLR